MPWTAPRVERADPPTPSAERLALDGWLDYQRQTLLWKCAGLTGDQLATRSVPPSSMSLLGLVRHMTDVERVWWRIRVAGEALSTQYWTDASPDADFDEVDPGRAEADFQAYAAEVEGCRVLARSLGLEDTFVHPRGGQVMDVRWVYVHLIEEYARHNGHADLLRERVDGQVGD